MLNRGGGGAVRSLLDRLRPPPRGRMSPAAAKQACFCSFGHSDAKVQRWKGGLDLGAGRRFAPGSALSLKSCLDWQEGGRFRRVEGDDEAVEIRARVLAPQRQLFVHDSEVRLSEEVSAKSVDGSGACSMRGKRLGFPEEGVPTKMVVAVDVDEVLGSFLAALNRFIAERYSWNHSVSEYHVYEFFKIWNCSREKANFLVHEFFTTHYFQDGIHPIPGA